MSPEFNTDFDPRHGEMVDVSPLLRRIVCNNPSKYTFHGTGTYVIGHGDVAVVDPGPRDPAHVEALLRALGEETVRAILITHTHGDHSPAAAALHDATGAPVLGFGPHPEDAISEEADADGENPAAANDAHRPDIDFDPETRLAHGDTVDGPGWTVKALHTPGHISNHLCFALVEENAVLTGDHVMGWSTTIIPPPDGDVSDYLRSLQLLLDRSDEVLYPTHGGPVDDPQRYVSALLNHRLRREAQILNQLAEGPASAKQMVAVLYADVRKELHRPAARSVVAHLTKLHNEGRAAPTIAAASTTSSDTVWTLS
ncbi:MAG: MBL fold metallo-hydrolase [Acidimicrobiaceae bacterium]|nr:MBL fold metallo-hydrolase [Acidimicrobiaceae bacterium]MXW76870.1 MBL fold metallo-hydrolase [Acidimicrobiaceae bacterium]MYC41557.1 MBL fold metallo-hydrolase [Acidimicrobiaceae bacterium]MYD05533.1 MBL fold metallo-hydrolase [Acidimicrobiaceae bacterium]MYH87519.1 MBL fold metallo-hydrolase [Acidimicrobiaceae bacterium]